MSKEYKQYFSNIEDSLSKLYRVAAKARSKGLDPALNPEPKVTRDIAERVEKLIGPPGVGERIRELENMDRREMAFKVAEEIIHGRFARIEREKSADQAIRSALAIMTEGVTIAPIQGIPEIKIKKNPDGTQFLSVYFAGPIRPAGGTAQALTLVLADFVRRHLGLERYQPSEEAVKRFVEEVRLYERRVRRFQYHVSDVDIETAMRNLPVEATGVGTDPFEVSSFRDVQGIETNRLRGGALIVVVDGIIGRAGKLCGICDKLRLEGWEWLRGLGDDGSKASEPTASFMEEIIIGRPVFSFPHRVGGFRLRYGRARNTGLAAVGVHPATMIVLNKFLTTGVQLRIELPGKSAVVTPVDSIEPPVVKLKDGSVLRVESVEDAEGLVGKLESILSLGDILVNAGDFIQNNKNLLPAGYDENQWLLDLTARIRKMGQEAFSEGCSIALGRLEALLKDPQTIPTSLEALAISELGVPLHPRFTYLWSDVSKNDLLNLRDNLAASWTNSKPVKLLLSRQDRGTLETLLVPHTTTEGGSLLKEAAPILERCLALNRLYVEIDSENPLEIVRKLSELDVREKAPIWVGARMGRPEKAKERKMSPYVHSLFPVERAGGSQRDILKTDRGQAVTIEIINRKCPKCGIRSFGVICPDCGVELSTEWRCPRCGRPIENENCSSCGVKAVAYSRATVDVRELLNRDWKRIGGPLPGRFKGVRRLMNLKRLPEPLGKGLIRARYDLSLFKDGTIRFDITDAPLTHFSPREIGAPIDKLRGLGYTHDVDGAPLESQEQMLELKVQDIVLPEECGDHLVKVSRFIDDLLTQFYGIEAFYNFKERDEFVGSLVLGLAPHTSAAAVGRVIGYTKTRVCYAHPLWHAAKRRNCDGDEDAIMLVLDTLLNFSQEYLPEQIGGLMDAPLFVIPVLNPSEVDKEAHNIDMMKRYPPEFYMLSTKASDPGVYEGLLDTLGKRLGTEAQFQGFGFTERCSDINLGAHQGAYTSLKTMLEKLDSQLELSKKLRAVDAKSVAMGVLTSHFMKDIVGNLRAYTSQRFRCVKCNKRYKRPPLKGVCSRCDGPISQTVYRGGIEKYIEPAWNLVKRYGLNEYFSDRLKLVMDEVESIFPKEPDVASSKQIDLTDFLKDR